jgi:hypothetical protein
MQFFCGTGGAPVGDMLRGLKVRSSFTFDFGLTFVTCMSGASFRA